MDLIGLKMNFKESVREELKKTPIASGCAALGFINSQIFIVLNFFMKKSEPSIANSSNLIFTGLDTFNILLVISIFVSISIFFAFIVRLLLKDKFLSALIVSIPLAALINFFSLLLIYIAPPRELNAHLFDSAHSLILYSSVTIFIIFLGNSVFWGLAPSNEIEKSDSRFKSLDLIGAWIFVWLIWVLFVSMGQNQLTKTFLPEMTHGSKGIQSKGEKTAIDFEQK